MHVITNRQLIWCQKEGSSLLKGPLTRPPGKMRQLSWVEGVWIRCQFCPRQMRSGISRFPRPRWRWRARELTVGTPELWVMHKDVDSQQKIHSSCQLPPSPCVLQAHTWCSAREKQIFVYELMLYCWDTSRVGTQQTVAVLKINTFIFPPTPTNSVKDTPFRVALLKWSSIQTPS